MSEVKRKCKYYCEKTGWKCPYDALQDSKEGFCIFHERRENKDIAKFNEGIKNILEETDLDAYHFEGFFFPSTIEFSELKFNKDVYFTGAKFCGEATYFDQSEFSGEYTSFEDAEFHGEYTGFLQAKFSGKNCWFSWARFCAEHTTFLGAEFSGESAEFWFAEFSGENTSFYAASFSNKNTSFSGTSFSSIETNLGATQFSAQKTDFEDVEFSGEKTVFNHTRFSGGEARFDNARFSGKFASFYCTAFSSKILFVRTSFEAKTIFTGVDLRNCAFIEIDLKNVDFTLSDWDWKYELRNERDVDGLARRQNLQKSQVYFNTSEVYRQLKVQFHNKRDFAKAGMFHFREQECKRRACRLPQEFFKWVFLWILRVSCGYGEKLRNVGLTSVALMFLFAIGYMFLGLHNVNDGAISRNIWTSLVFSVKGFFPLWRFQQYEVVGDFANLVAGIEFLLGAFMVGLFIYVFRRRMEK